MLLYYSEAAIYCSVLERVVVSQIFRVTIRLTIVAPSSGLESWTDPTLTLLLTRWQSGIPRTSTIGTLIAWRLVQMERHFGPGLSWSG